MWFKYEYNIYFFRSLKHPNRYFIKEYRDDNLYYFMEFFKSEKWNAAARYPNLLIEDPFIPIEIKDDKERSKFREYLKQHIGKKVDDEDPDVTDWLGSQGWYEIDEINPDKWLSDFNDFYKLQTNRKQEFQKEDKKGIQTSLF